MLFLGNKIAENCKHLVLEKGDNRSEAVTKLWVFFEMKIHRAP